MDGLGTRVLVDVELDDLQLALALLRHLLQHRRHRPAGAAPWRPEVDQHRDGTVLHFALPGGVAGGDGLVGKDSLFALSAARVVAQARARDAVERATTGAGVFDAVVVHRRSGNHRDDAGKGGACGAVRAFPRSFGYGQDMRAFALFAALD